MDEELKKVIGETRWYLDFHSVIDGFRHVCLVGLTEFPSNFNKKYGTSLPSFLDQAVFIGDYIQHNHPNHRLIPGWGPLYFLAHKSKTRNVERLLHEHPRPVSSKEGERKLGLILGFPTCCVDAHSEDRLPMRNFLYPLPFSPCNDSCEASWMDAYKKLAKKYSINISKAFIDGNV